MVIRLLSLTTMVEPHGLMLGPGMESPVTVTVVVVGRDSLKPSAFAVTETV